jgi:mitochondrial fission protein ELM1
VTAPPPRAAADMPLRAGAAGVEAPVARPAPPRVWLLLGDKPGDNAQVDAVADALGWPCERKVLQWRPPYATAKPRFRATLDHVDLGRSTPLEPPWPDLVLTIGRRPSMVALWLAAQSPGRTRIVLFGKPSGMMDRFALVVAGAEVQLPARPNVVPIRLPLMRAKAVDIEAAAAKWRTRLDPLPRPLIALLVGGPTVPFAFDLRVADRLRALATEIAQAGGTPYVTTSRRTPRPVVAALRAGLPDGARLFEWTPDGADNPYLALLGLADGCIVTGDSVSMLAEVVRARKPLAILDLPLGRWGAFDQVRRTLLARLYRPDAGPLAQLIGGLAHGGHLLEPTRDFRAFHRMLIDSGLAVRAGEPLAPPTGTVPDDLPAVVSRIRTLAGPAVEGVSG